jgi:hypothetical protein
METILICPGERPAVGFLAQTVPLVVVPILGESLVNWWIQSLAGSDVKEVVILATDRPDVVRAAAGNGSRWGVRVRVEAVLHEPDAADLRAGSAPGTGQSAASGAAGGVIAMDRLPGAHGQPLFRSYRGWFGAACAWMFEMPKVHRIGVREVAPGVWIGHRAQLAPTAQLRPPCWIGEHVQVGPHAVVGPNAILEDRVIVDSTAEIQSSAVGPDTFVGALTKLEGSIAWGSTLIDWRNGSCTQVPDTFLLSALGQRYLRLPPARAGQGIRPGWRTWLNRPWGFRRQIPDATGQ